MDQPAPGTIGRFLGWGSLLGALAGFVVTGSLAGLALATDSLVDGLVAALTVGIGTVAGTGVGLLSSAVAAAVHSILRSRVGARTLWLATVAASAITAGGGWLVVSRLAEWMQTGWMTGAVALGAAALAAFALPRITRVDKAARPPLAPWIVSGTMVCIGLGIAGAGTAGVGPLAPSLGYVEIHMSPVGAQPLGSSRTLSVAVAWPEDGYCSGQFSVEFEESSTEVRLADVIGRSDRNYWNPSPCVGVGTAHGLAWVDVELNEPLGDRVVLDGLGVEVPVQSG
jgi:hypothetical protein